jgi:hypothetical protein
MPAIRTVLLVPHTHHDIGYTASPRVVDDMHVHVVGRVLELAEAHGEPGPEQFRWTFEVARPVLRFLERAAPEDRERLRRLVDEGRVAVTGGYLNMTQLPSLAEFEAAYDELAVLRSAGLPVRTEQHGDVNGIAWGTVDAMRRAGIGRLLMALNPDHGRAPYPQPTGFWWVGPSGARIFVWLSTHYGVGEEWGIIDGRAHDAEAHIRDFVRGLEKRDDYPYDVALVHAANDNRWPTERYLDIVRHWNAVHPEAPMRTATTDQALDILQAQAAWADVPVVRGEWSDWWSHGHGSTAREVAVYREARSFARAAQTTLGLVRLRGDGEPALAEVIGYRRGPVRLRSDAEVEADLARVDEDLLLFAEHTWGSWETYTKPFSNFSYSHWNAKAASAYAAYDRARDLAVEGMFRFAASGPADASDGPVDRVILVINPTERERTEPVVVEVDGQRRERRVVTVPPFGTAVAALPAPATVRAGRELATSRYRVTVDPGRGGVTSLVDLATGRDLVDATVAHALGAVVVETVTPGDDHPMLQGELRAFHPDTPGPDFEQRAAVGTDEPEIRERDDLVEICWTTTPPGLPAARSTLTLYRDLDVIDLEVELVKPEAFGPESVFVAFPFAVDSPRFLLETAGAVYAAEDEQLPDTSMDWYSIQHAIGVTDDQTGVLWGSFDAPLVQVGGFHTGRWARHLDVVGGHVNSWLMNNLHFTNFQARQEGTHRYRYRFAASPGPVAAQDVRVFGRSMLEPLQARVYTGPVHTGPGGLHVEPADRVFAEVRPIAAGGVRVRLRALSDEPVEAHVWFDGSHVQGGRPVTLAPHGVADVVLRRVTA